MPDAVEQAKNCFETVLEHGPRIEIDHYLVYVTRALFRVRLTYWALRH